MFQNTWKDGSSSQGRFSKLLQPQQQQLAEQQQQQACNLSSGAAGPSEYRCGVMGGESLCPWEGLGSWPHHMHVMYVCWGGEGSWPHHLHACHVTHVCWGGEGLCLWGGLGSWPHHMHVCHVCMLGG